MVGRKKAPTEKEKRRFDLMQQGGCIASLQLGMSVEGEIHHLLNGYRRGHSYSICLSPYFHRGILPEGLTYKQARDILGPSMAEEKKAFHEKYGDDEFLLNLQEQVIEKIEDSII